MGRQRRYPEEFPERADDNGLPNNAGKVLRLDVEGASAAQPGWGAPFDDGLYAFATGLGNPVALGVHPLTGQIYAAERGENTQAELDIIDSGTSYGWPCLQGTGTGNTSASSCLGAGTAATVYANHPAWRRPIVTHDGNPVIMGPTAYTGRGYPAEFYGDVFYLLRDDIVAFNRNEVDATGLYGRAEPAVDGTPVALPALPSR